MPCMADIHNFLNLLKNVKQNGSNGWTALCPAHDDMENSLGVSLGSDDRILVKCYAGCTHKDIVAAVGWKEKDLFPDGRSGNFNPGNSVSGSGPQGPGPARAITIADLAADKGIPIDFLSFYTEQLPFGVKITYKNLDGTTCKKEQLSSNSFRYTGSYSDEGSSYLNIWLSSVPYDLLNTGI